MIDLLKLRRTCFEALLDGHVQIIVLVDYPGVRLPDSARQQAKPAVEGEGGPRGIVLDYGYGLARPPSFMDVGEHGIAATLIFNGVDAPVFIPWAAIVAIRTPDAEFISGFVVEIAAPAPEPPKKPGLKSV